MPTDSSLGPRGMDCACLLVASAGRISSKVLVTKEDNILNPAHCIEETLLDKVIFFQPHNFWAMVPSIKGSVSPIRGACKLSKCHLGQAKTFAPTQTA